MSFRGHDRNKVLDDPIVLRPPLASGTLVATSAPQAATPAVPTPEPKSGGALAWLRELVTGVGDSRALRVRGVPASYPVGGQSVTVSATVTTTPTHVVGPNDTLTNVLQWSAPDGKSVRGVLTLVPSAPAQHVGDPPSAIWCLITMGSPRGKIAWWELAPAIVPVEGTYLRVDAIYARVPKYLGVTTAGNLNEGNAAAAPIVPQWNFAHSSQITVNFFDEFADRYPGVSIVGTPQQPAQLVTSGSFGAPQWQNPVILHSIEFSNSNTADVWIGWADTTAPNLNTVVVNGIVKVPAGQSVAIGQGLLGSFGVGLSLFGVTAPGQPPYTNDTNDQNVFATIRGLSLQTGT